MCAGGGVEVVVMIVGLVLLIFRKSFVVAHFRVWWYLASLYSARSPSPFSRATGKVLHNLL